MPQQLNLNDPRFTPRQLPCSARQAAGGCLVALLALMAGSQWMHWQAALAEAEAKATELNAAPLRAQILQLAQGAPGGQGPASAGGNAALAAGTGSPAAWAALPGASSPAGAPGLLPGEPAAQLDLPRLKLTEAAQRRVLGALEAGAAGKRDGHAEYLAALARQAPGTVWITRFAVSEDGSAVELEGRMTDTTRFADYLRRLNAEPRFKGRPFAQLQLKALPNSNGGAGAPVTEFALRSTQAAAQTLPDGKPITAGTVLPLPLPPLPSPLQPMAAPVAGADRPQANAPATPAAGDAPPAALPGPGNGSATVALQQPLHGAATPGGRP